MNEDKVLEYFKEIQADIKDIRGNMATKDDLASVKTDISSLKTDVSSLKTDVSSLKDTQQKIVEKLVEHDDRLERIETTMVTKADKDELVTAIANLTSIVEKIREDQVFTVEWIKRLQTQVDEQQKIIDFQAEEIRQIKLHLKLA